ncbi:hypothetical protein MBLNU459_g0850t1 [Dothideomycetes sp. NU459]
MPRGRPLIIQSSLALLDVFIFFYKRVPTALVDWSCGQQSFNACMILILDCFESSDIDNIDRVEQAYAIFVELEKNDTNQLAALAVSRISEGLLRLRDHIENKPVLLAVPSGQQQERSSSFDWTSDSGPQQQQQQQQRSPRYSESVMGATGMFLLEDHGLQAKQEQTFPPPLSDVPPFIAAVSVAVMPAAAAASNMAVSQSAPQSRTQSLAHPSQHTGGIPLHYRGHQQHPQQQQQQQQGRSASMFIAPCPPAFDPMDPRRDSVYGPIMQTQQQQQAQQQFFRLGHSPRPQQQQQQQPHQQQQQQQHAEDWQGLNSRLLNPSRGIPQLQQQQQQLQLQKRRKASHQERRDG